MRVFHELAGTRLAGVAVIDSPVAKARCAPAGGRGSQPGKPIACTAGAPQGSMPKPMSRVDHAPFCPVQATLPASPPRWGCRVRRCRAVFSWPAEPVMPMPCVNGRPDAERSRSSSRPDAAQPAPLRRKSVWCDAMPPGVCSADSRAFIAWSPVTTGSPETSPQPSLPSPPSPGTPDCVVTLRPPTQGPVLSRGDDIIGADDAASEVLLRGVAPDPTRLTTRTGDNPRR